MSSKNTMVACSLAVGAFIAAPMTLADDTKTSASQILAVATEFTLISAAELNTQLQGANAPFVFDANVPQVRSDKGVVKGARQLSDYQDYDVAKELPVDKSKALVFYCYNEQCMASHMAAKRALQAGFQHVAVMREGIAGWVSAGYPVDKS